MITNSAIVEQEQTCWMCPETWEGILRDGSRFYLQLRWGVATLGLGATVDAAWKDDLAPAMRVGDDLLGAFESGEQRDDVFAALLLMRRP